MLLSAVILGMLGSFHCIGMCGPIAFLLPLDHKNKTKKAFQIVIYHSGRILTYALIGFIFGWLGKGLFVSGLQQRLSIIIGIIIILIALIPLKKILFKKYINGIDNPQIIANRKILKLYEKLKFITPNFTPATYEIGPKTAPEITMISHRPFIQNIE